MPVPRWRQLCPEAARQILQKWQPGLSLDQQRAQIQDLARTTAPDAQRIASALTEELAAGRPVELRQALACFLQHVPAAFRRVLRSPGDPAGLTVPGELTIAEPDDLLLWLPVRRPRFEPGMLPLAEAPWQLEELLGVGPLNEVWKARDPHLPNSESVVLKFCIDPASAKVLRNESKALDRCVFQARHPGIVALRRTHLSADPPCLEYEYRSGGDLASAVAEWRRLPQGPSPAQIARIILRVASIVAFAHRLEPPIVHRDLKPANILVHRLPDGKLAMRISDLGNGAVAASDAIRQALRGAQRPQQLLAGLRGARTSLYASPQQLRGADADPRDDVHALGVIWYQLLTGTLTNGPSSDAAGLSFLPNGACLPRKSIS